MADSSNTSLAYIAEVTEGTTPDTPAFTNIRFNSESLKASISNATSDEVCADGNVKEMEQTGESAGGNVAFDLTYGGWTDDWLAALFRSSWATNVLKNGVTPAPMTIEKLLMPDAGDQYHRLTGARVDSLSLAIKAGQKVTGSFGVRARKMLSDQAEISGATYVAANTNGIITAAKNFGSLTMTGITTPQLVGLNLNFNGNTRYQPVVGDVAAKGIGQGRFVVTGDMQLYFENEEAYELYLNGTGADLSFYLGGASTKKYSFAMGNIKFSDGDVLVSGNDQDLLCSLQFQALYYASDAASCKITRTP